MAYPKNVKPSKLKAGDIWKRQNRFFHVTKVLVSAVPTGAIIDGRYPDNGEKQHFFMQDGFDDLEVVGQF